MNIEGLDLTELSKIIVNSVNSCDNDYDAVEKVFEILSDTLVLEEKLN